MPCNLYCRETTIQDLSTFVCVLTGIVDSMGSRTFNARVDVGSDAKPGFGGAGEYLVGIKIRKDGADEPQCLEPFPQTFVVGSNIFRSFAIGLISADPGDVITIWMQSNNPAEQSIGVDAYLYDVTAGIPAETAGQVGGLPVLNAGLRVPAVLAATPPTAADVATAVIKALHVLSIGDYTYDSAGRCTGAVKTFDDGTAIRVTITYNASGQYDTYEEAEEP